MTPIDGADSRLGPEDTSAQPSWAAAAGILGALALGASFLILPRPPALGAPLTVLDAYARENHDRLLWATWLEGTGSILYVLFLLTLAQRASAMPRVSGVLTALAAAIVVTVSIFYDVCLIAIAQSAATGGSQLATGVTAYGLFAAVEHAFLLAPSIFLPLGFAIRGSNVLPRVYAPLAIALGCTSEILGLVGLFYAQPNNHGAAGVAINVLVGVEAIWVIAAALSTISQRQPTFATA
jgi:hypothetical protein